MDAFFETIIYPATNQHFCKVSKNNIVQKQEMEDLESSSPSLLCHSVAYVFNFLANNHHHTFRLRISKPT